MQDIELLIKDVVKNSLIEKRKNHLQESFLILENSDKHEFIKNYVDITIKLLNEGYDFDEIESQLSEIDNPIDTLFGDKLDFGKMTRETIWSTVKEFILKTIFEWMGINKGLSTSMSQAFADYDVRNLLKPFKNSEYCIGYLPDIIDQILEVTLRYLASKATKSDRNDYGWSGVGDAVMGNFLGVTIKESNISERISTKICKMIHNE